MSHESYDIAEAEPFYPGEGNMCGTDMRGTIALPGSETSLRAQGARWNLGDLEFDRAPARPATGSNTPSMYGPEKSDEPIVPMKPTNKAGDSGGVGGGKGFTWGESGRFGTLLRTQSRTTQVNPTAAYEMAKAMPLSSRRAGCGKAARPDLCGGAGVIPFPTATEQFYETAWNGFPEP